MSAGTKCLAAIRVEYATYPDDLATVRSAHLTTVGDIPLIVLSHGQTLKLAQNRRGEGRSLHPEQSDEWPLLGDKWSRSEFLTSHR